jgi:enamine deaminase RidA (YjgF/YER057c/UK114 family)
MGDLLFTGPTYGMHPETRKVGADARSQAELCARSNQELYDLAGHALENVAQMFVWYHDAPSRVAALQYTEVLFPDPGDRPAIHYIHSNLPFWAAEVQGQFLVQYDIISVRNARRSVINLPGVRPMDAGSTPAGVAIGNLCFTSVCLGQDPRTGDRAPSLAEQTELAFRNALAVVGAAGFAPADVGHAYVWYGDHAAREVVDEVWARVFARPDDRPARHCVIADVPDGALVGVELTAAR